MEISRRKNSIRNLFTSILSVILSVILNFVTRTIFIDILGTKYLGITGLFTNIISILALTEMGMGTALTYYLYKPLANKNTTHIKAILDFYRKVYVFIGVTIGLIGLLMLPFIPYLIKDDTNFININLIFVIYLMQTISSYLFYAYKMSLIRANQQEYVINVIKSYFSIITSIIQIIILLLFENFTLYVFSVVLTNIIMNLTIAIRADKMFPYLKEKNTEKLKKEEKKLIYKNAYAIFFYKIYDKVLNSTDSIIISKFLGLNILGIYSNYLLLYSTIQMLLSKFYTSILASLSDLYIRGETKYEYKLFKSINIFTVYLFGLVSVIVYYTVNIFIELWIGEAYKLNQLFILLFSLTILINGYRVFFDTFRTSMGLFQQAKYRPIIGALINIFLSLLFVNYMGLNGVILATIIANVLTFIWYDPYIILKHGLNKSAKKYYMTNMLYLFSIILASVIVHFVLLFLKIKGFISIVIIPIIIFIIMTVIFHLLYRKNAEYLFILNTVMQIFKSVKKRFNKC